MFTQIRSYFILAATLLIFIASANAAPPVNPYAGTWAGTFVTDNGGWGPQVVTINANGSFTGTVTYYPGHLSGTLIGHVNQNGFGAFIFHGFQSPPIVIPYLLQVSIDADGILHSVAPVPWSGGFTAFSTLHRQ